MFKEEIVRKNGKLVRSVSFDLTPWLAMLFIGLLIAKLVGVDISWLAVFAPIWLPFAFIFGLMGFMFGVYLLFIIGSVLAKMFA